MYSNLHTRSTYSTGRAIGTCADIFKRAKEIGLHSVAITDTNTMSGALDFASTAKDFKMPAVLGTEVNYYDDLESSRRFISLVLLAKNQNGYQNLCKLTSLSNDESRFDDGPHLNVEDLRHHADGIVALTSNVRGPMGAASFDLQMEEWLPLGMKRIKTLQEIFGEDLYLELTPNDESFQPVKIEHDVWKYMKVKDSNPQIAINRLLIGLSNRMGIKYVVSSDAHMPKREQKTLLDIMVSNVRSPMMHEPRWIRSEDELKSGFAISEAEFNTACANSISVAEKCSGWKLEFKPQVVSYPSLLHPLGRDGQSKMELVLEIIKNYGRVDFSDKVYFDRLQYEMKAVCFNGRIDLIDYFLVLEDLCRWCRENGIVVGPGRGSGAGSLLNYGLYITHLDPIKNGLLFERFISEGRIQKGTLPDVDLDFSDQESARNYLISKYGEDRVKPIGVMQTLHLKNALKDAFKALHPEVEFFQINNVSVKLPKMEQEEKELDYYERCLVENQTFAELLGKYPDVRAAIGELIGFNRQPGIHPCGLAISQDPLKDFAPMRQLKSKWVLEYDADSAAMSGIIKYDVLSLTTLKYWKTCIQLIKKHHSIDIDVNKIPHDDQFVYSAFEKGDTESVFQFNSDVAKSILMQIKVTSIDDLSMVTSVGRPGPMRNNQHHEFIKRKNGAVEPIPPHPALEELLKDTYGIMIYQEGVMKASQILGGFTLAEADDIRKAMGKKKIEYIKPYKDRFVKHAVEHYADIDTARAEEIWHLMETFSGYGFNKSHSMSYALIGYICQYLKFHYAVEWWTACLTHATDTEHLGAYYEAAKRLIKLPDINRSTDQFYISEVGDRYIQMPFSVVKGIGDAAAAEINSKRPFASFEDFFQRVNKTKCNKKVVMQLIFAGAFDSFLSSKTELIKKYYEMREEKIPEEFANMTASMVAEKIADALPFIIVDYADVYSDLFTFHNKVKFSEIKNSLFVKRDLIRQKQKMDPKKSKHEADISYPLPVMVGKITEIKKSTTKAPHRITISNAGETIYMKVWPNEWDNYEAYVHVGSVVEFHAIGSFYFDSVQLTCVGIRTVEQIMGVKQNGPK